MKKYLSILYVILWMILIFIMSSFDGDTSSMQSSFIANIIADIFNINNINLLGLIIRKIAHFSEYFILGILVINMLKNFKIKWYFAIIICIVYACSDEVHQLFINNRVGNIIDILIDSFGSICAIFLKREH